VRQHYSSPVQYHQTKDDCTGFVSLYNQTVTQSRVAPTVHSVNHHRSSADHGGDPASSFSCGSRGCLRRVGMMLRSVPAPCLARRRCDVAVTQPDERQASADRLWRQPGAGWGAQPEPGRIPQARHREPPALPYRGISAANTHLWGWQKSLFALDLDF